MITADTRAGISGITKKKIFCTTMAIYGARQVSAQESAYYLLGYDFVVKSRLNVELNVTPPEQQYQRIRANALQSLADDDENISVLPSWAPEILEYQTLSAVPYGDPAKGEALPMRPDDSSGYSLPSLHDFLSRYALARSRYAIHKPKVGKGKVPVEEALGANLYTYVITSAGSVEHRTYRLRHSPRIISTRPYVPLDENSTRGAWALLVLHSSHYKSIDELGRYDDAVQTLCSSRFLSEMQWQRLQHSRVEGAVAPLKAALRALGSASKLTDGEQEAARAALCSSAAALLSAAGTAASAAERGRRNAAPALAASEAHVRAAAAAAADAAASLAASVVLPPAAAATLDDDVTKAVKKHVEAHQQHAAPYIDHYALPRKFLDAAALKLLDVARALAEARAATRAACEITLQHASPLDSVLAEFLRADSEAHEDIQEPVAAPPRDDGEGDECSDTSSFIDLVAAEARDADGASSSSSISGICSDDDADTAGISHPLLNAADSAPEVAAVDGGHEVAAVDGGRALGAAAAEGAAVATAASASESADISDLSSESDVLPDAADEQDAAAVRLTMSASFLRATANLTRQRTTTQRMRSSGPKSKAEVDQDAEDEAGAKPGAEVDLDHFIEYAEMDDGDDGDMKLRADLGEEDGLDDKPPPKSGRPPLKPGIERRPAAAMREAASYLDSAKSIRDARIHAEMVAIYNEAHGAGDGAPSTAAAAQRPPAAASAALAAACGTNEAADAEAEERGPAKMQQLFDHLSPEQQSAFIVVDAHLRGDALIRTADNPEGQLRLLLSGVAGTGKSHLIRAIVYRARMLFPYSAGGVFGPVVIVAYTGRAALNVCGRTLDSVFDTAGYHKAYAFNKNGKPTTGTESATARRAFNERTQTRLAGVKLVIIDEVSMCGARKLAVVDTIMRIANSCKTNATLGGKTHFLCVGDL